MKQGDLTTAGKIQNGDFFRLTRGGPVFVKLYTNKPGSLIYCKLCGTEDKDSQTLTPDFLIYFHRKKEFEKPINPEPVNNQIKLFD